MNYLWTSLTAATQQPEHLAADTVNRICERIADSALLEDRRDAVRALKALAREYQLEVGTQGMDIFMQVLQNDRSDIEIVRYALEGLALVLLVNTAEEGESPKQGDIGVGFAEIFVKRPEYVSVILSLLEETDLYTRYYSIQILSSLLANQTSKLQECILSDPFGVSRIMALLLDERHAIRSEALLMLVQLTKGHPGIQKLVVFENVYELVLGIIKEKHYSAGGQDVQECLLVLYHVLRKNIANQNFFRETNCIKELAPFLDVSSQSKSTIALGNEEEETECDKISGWPEQQVTNMQLMIEVIRLLLVPDTPNTVANQNALRQQGALQGLLNLAMTNNLPSRLWVPLRLAVAGAVCGNRESQALFLSVTDTAKGVPRPIIVALVADLLAFRAPFDRRCAGLVCLDSVLRKNTEAQVFIASALNQSPSLPAAQESDTPTAVGAQLLAAVRDTQDGVSHWAACLALSHIVRDNEQSKDLFLATVDRVGSLPMMDMLVNAFACTGLQQARVWCGVLVLLCTLCVEYPPAIGSFLQRPSALSFVIQQCQQAPQGLHSLTPGLAALLLGICIQWNDNKTERANQAALLNVIHRVIKPDRYLDVLGSLIGQEAFANAQQHQQKVASNPKEVWLDYPFTVLAKKARDDIRTTVNKSLQTDTLQLIGEKKNIQDNSAMINEYEEIVQRQRNEMKQIQSKLAALTTVNQVPKYSESELAEIERMEREIAQMKAQAHSLAAQHKQTQIEQDELLLMLSELGAAKKNMKARLRQSGEEVSESDDDSDEAD